MIFQLYYGVSGMAFIDFIWGIVYKVLLLRLFWFIGCAFIYLHFNFGLSESFIKFWVSTLISGVIVGIPLILFCVANPTTDINGIRVVSVVGVLGLILFSIQ